MNYKLKDLRTTLGFSQREIANLLSMEQCSWSNCENGRRNLSLKACYKLIKLAKLKDIELSIEYLKPE